ncbi:Leukotriene-B4 omega-hydroxylase 3 [Hypsizygus marmoreus]|uniref:Leukotriene-B4 omega-hydroxylase 3 n=1 Tax=Hypsizygus marmoreus TaxID=39966 RepID=A0A369JWV3_HYPMA|nr:Leukotriene-B4 omega-hydroxylase 3 [Hypsizygus marmoreus]
MILKVLFTAGALFSISRAYQFYQGWKKLHFLPGFYPLFSPMSLLGALIPSTWWNPGINWPWVQRHTAFFNHSHDVIAMVPILLGDPLAYVGSLDVTRQLLSAEGKTGLTKPPEFTSILLLWGDNLVSASGEMWKRHRRLVAPAFTPKTYALVWEETITTYREMVVAQGWDQGKEFVIPKINSLPMKFALIIISRCGFGLPMSWVDVEDKEDALSFGQSLSMVCEYKIIRLILPRWVYKLPIKKLHDIEEAYVTLAEFMRSFVLRRKQEIDEKGVEEEGQRGDLFTRLVAALGSADKYGLEEQEVIGNTFTLMFAGHETTAKVISATLGLLAIHQGEQEKAYQEILSVCPAGTDPQLEDAPRLTHLLACFQEALRLYPPGSILSRETTQDVVVEISHPSKQSLVIEKGTRLIIDMIAIHYDPKVFPDPERFLPSRWYGVPDLDVSMYGIGPRACIGRKFAQTEATCFLALFLRDWKLDVVLKDGETRQEYEARVMGKASIDGLAFGVGPIALKLVRRG